MYKRQEQKIAVQKENVYSLLEYFGQGNSEMCIRDSSITVQVCPVLLSIKQNEGMSGHGPSENW